MPRLSVLLLRRSERYGTPAPRVGGDRAAAPDPPPAALNIPRPRPAPPDEQVAAPLVIHRGVAVLRLFDVAPPTLGLRPGSLVLGLVLGAWVANRRRIR